MNDTPPYMYVDEFNSVHPSARFAYQTMSTTNSAGLITASEFVSPLNVRLLTRANRGSYNRRVSGPDGSCGPKVCSSYKSVNVFPKTTRIALPISELIGSPGPMTPSFASSNVSNDLSGLRS